MILNPFVPGTPECLLAVVLGDASEAGVDAARVLLGKVGGVCGLSRAHPPALVELFGVDRRVAEVAVCAASLCRFAAGPPPRERIGGPPEIAAMMSDKMASFPVEKMFVLLMDTNFRLMMDPVEVYSGTVNETHCKSNLMFRVAVAAAATSIVAVHNHPSGNVMPSQADLRETREFVVAGRTLGIMVQDHIIIGRPVSPGAPNYFSLRESGMVDFSF